MKPITNPNDRNSEFYDLIYSDEKCEAVTSAECTLIAGLAGEAPKNILDVGIGTGRHAIPLAKMGYKITGIDFSKGMLKVLNDKDIQGINAMYGDILKMKLDKDEKFDLVILMWNSFNEIALTKSDAVKLIIKIKSILGLL